MTKAKRHFIIPDTQVKPGVPIKHFEWLGKAIQEYKPDRIIHLGDHWDFESVSLHNSPKSQEGLRLIECIKSGNKALEILEEFSGGYKPLTKDLLRGNHEYRLQRYIDNNPLLEGAVGFHMLNDKELGWNVVEYKHGSPQVIVRDGVHYAHYFANINTGKPIGGTATYKLAAIGSPFVQGHVQGYDIGTKQFATGRVIRGIVCGSCLTPDHKVLTADLCYVPLGDVRVGDKLISFDEQLNGHRYRRYRTGTVEAVKRDVAQCFRVVLDNGKEFKVTGDHYWLTRVGGPTAVRVGESYLWRQTSQLRVGTRIPRLLDEWETDDSRDGGYLSGIYDGEGSLYARETNAKGGAVMQLSLSQRPGLVLDECLRILSERLGLSGLIHTNQKGVSSIRIKGGAAKCARLLGALRPVRLLAKFRPELLGSLRSVEDSRVVSIEPIGEQEIVRIAIDHKTMIVEGYPHHNCYLHDEPYKGMANNHWRGAVILNEVRDGEFSEMPLTMNYLCEKYEGMPLKRFMQRNYKNAKERFSVAR